MTFEEIKQLLEQKGFDKVAWDNDDSVLDHCLQVAETASSLARLIAQRGYPIDIEHCEIGGLLHDFSVPVGNSSRYSYKSAWGTGLLRYHSYEVLAELVRTGEVELAAADVIKGTVAIPHKFATPATLEEKVIAFADWVNHPEPTKLPTPSPVWNDLIRSFGPLGTMERELARLSGVPNLWDALAPHRTF